MEKLKAAKSLAQNKVGNFGVTFGVHRKSHNKDAEWLKELRSEINEIKQGNMKITTEIVTGNRQGRYPIGSVQGQMESRATG